MTAPRMTAGDLTRIRKLCARYPESDFAALLTEHDAVRAERDAADLALRQLTAEVDAHACLSASSVPAYLVAFHEAWMKAPPLVRAGAGADLLLFANHAHKEANASVAFAFDHDLQRRVSVCARFSDIAWTLVRLARSLTQQADNDAEAAGIDADTGAKPWRRRKKPPVTFTPDLGKVIVRNGKQLAILRPSDPERALRRARGKVKAVRGKPGLSALLNDPKQVYTFVGLPTTDGHILDPLTGENLGRTHAGDSFVDYELLEAAIKGSEVAS